MKFAIIAAGEGSRLVSEGVKLPKPMVRVGGEPLIDRLLRIFLRQKATGIYVICNDLSSMVQDHLADIQKNGLDGQEVPLHFVVKSTPSSMHSFYELRHFLVDDVFCLTTVDTIFDEAEFGRYVSDLEAICQSGMADGLMGLTDYIDDEKPLYVDVDDKNVIRGYYDDTHHCHYISGGIYGLTPRAIDTLERCVQRGESRMRNFQRALVADGQKLMAYKFSKVLDIDHASDIAKAEKFLKQDVL